MNAKQMTRRRFVAAASAGSLAAVVSRTIPAYGDITAKANKPAILGGKPVRAKPFPGWPIWDKEADEERVVAVLRSGVWSRAGVVTEFEKTYAALLGARRCLATANGTAALLTALHVLGVGVGDEVLVTPYTFIASIDVIFLSGALPVMVDTDRETFQINPDKMEEKITENTRAILPVHILGLPADMDRINAIAKKHNLLVIEDACQAWLAEWRGKKCGTLGDLGCFSFQNSKHLTCGEGGAILGDNDEIMDRCHSYHNFGRPHGETMLSLGGYVQLGTKCRMTEFQAAILLAQMKRLEAQTQRRGENAAYLTSRIKDIPGITPHKLYDGVTRAAYHLYPFRYDPVQFDGLPRAKFLAALRAEGIPCSSGYGPINKDAFFEKTLKSRSFQRMYSRKRLDRCRQQNHCPDNDRLCREAVWFGQNMLLADKTDMDDIADAILKVYENRRKLV
jgi:dTDP-4-amino-4,6-dideoxygalactose transaminase